MPGSKDGGKDGDWGSKDGYSKDGSKSGLSGYGSNMCILTKSMYTSADTTCTGSVQYTYRQPLFMNECISTATNKSYKIIETHVNSY